MSNADVFQSYLERFTAGDVEGAAEYLVEDFRFEGPVLDSEQPSGLSRGCCPAGADRAGLRDAPPVGRRRSGLLDL